MAPACALTPPATLSSPARRAPDAGAGGGAGFAAVSLRAPDAGHTHVHANGTTSTCAVGAACPNESAPSAAPRARVERDASSTPARPVFNVHPVGGENMRFDQGVDVVVHGSVTNVTAAGAILRILKGATNITATGGETHIGKGVVNFTNTGGSVRFGTA